MVSERYEALAAEFRALSAAWHGIEVALNWYADSTNYPNSVMADAGDRARAALADRDQAMKPTTRTIMVADTTRKQAYGLDEAVIVRDLIKDSLAEGLKTRVDFDGTETHAGFIAVVFEGFSAEEFAALEIKGLGRSGWASFHYWKRSFLSRE